MVYSRKGHKMDGKTKTQGTVPCAVLIKSFSNEGVLYDV